MRVTLRHQLSRSHTPLPVHQGLLALGQAVVMLATGRATMRVSAESDMVLEEFTILRARVSSHTAELVELS